MDKKEIKRNGINSRWYIQIKFSSFENHITATLPFYYAIKSISLQVLKMPRTHLEEYDERLVEDRL